MREIQQDIRLIGFRRLGRRDLLRTTALQAAALLVIAVPAARAQPAPNARPVGGQVVAGQASIGQAAQSTTITQGSQRAAIDWRGFDVGAQQSVDFRQPSSSAITLNRVTSANPSQIAGRIQANGQVVIVNQSGVLFAKGAQVETAGLVASAAGITNQNFMRGNMVFDQAPHPGAQVRNDGKLTVRDQGLAALVAPSVVNTGVITARMGHVVLAGAEAHTVDLYGDGMLAINVTKQVTTVPTGPDGKPVAALVTNTGVVRADGGTVQLTARAVDGLVQNLVSAGGTISADTIGGKTGTVLMSGVGGSLSVTGRVSVAGRAPGDHGGKIELNATGTVSLASTARVNASGPAGGGVVAIGTTLARAQGGAAVTGEPTAKRTLIASGARIDADARKAGDGGRVTLLSTDKTSMAGTITARGGKASGNGGNVEVSGDTGFSLTGKVDVGAPHGSAGSILLDPQDLTIVASAGDTTPNASAPNVPAAGGGPNAIADASTDASIDVATIKALVGNVQLQATRDLTVAAALDLTLATSITRLELDAGRNLAVNAAITSPNADVGLFANTAGAGGGITIGAAVAAPGHTVQLVGDSLTLTPAMGSVSAATIEIAPASSIPVTLGGTVANTLSLPSTAGIVATGTLRLGGYTNPATATITPTATGIAIAGATNLTTVSPTLDLQTTTAGAVTQTAPLTVATLVGSVGSVTLNTAGNAIHNLGPFTTASGLALTTADLNVNGAITTGATAGTTLSLTATTGDLNINAAVSAPVVSLSSTLGNLSIGGAISTGVTAGASVSLYAQSGDVTETASGTIDTPSLSGSAVAGKAIFGNGGNQVAALGGFTTKGDFTLVDAGALVVTGPITTGTVGASAITLTTTAGDLTVGGLTAPSVALTAGGNLVVAGAISTRVANETGVGLAALDGDITQGASGSLNTKSLTATANQGTSATATGLIRLDATGNQISQIGSFVAQGDITLVNKVALATGSITSTGGNVAIEQAATNGLTLNSGATLAAGSGKTLSLVADSLVNQGATLSAASGVVEIAPASSIAVTLGTGPGLAIDPSLLAQTTAATLRIGSALNAATPSATSIAVANAVSPSAATLELDATAAIGQSAGAIITAGTLAAKAGSLALGQDNAVGTLGPVTTTGNLAFRNNQTLTIGGALATGSVAGTALSVTTATGDLIVGAAVSAPVVTLTAQNGDIAETASGGVSSGNLTVDAAKGSSAATGKAVLAAGSNAVGTLASVSTTGDFALVNGGDLTLTGAVQAGGNVALIEAAGNTLILGASALSAGTNKTLSLVADQIAFGAGTVSAPSGTVELAPRSAIGVTVGGSAGGTLSLPTLAALASTGTLRLGGYTDPTTATVTPTASGIALAGSIDLTAKAATLDLRTIATGAVTQGGPLKVGTLTGDAGSVSLQSNGNAVGTLGAFTTAGDFALVNGQSIKVGGVVSTGSAAGTTLSLTALFGDLKVGAGLSAPIVALTAKNGDVVQTAGTIAATTLTGSARKGGSATSSGSASFLDANAIQNLGAFNTDASFQLTSSDLTVTGNVTTGTAPGTAISLVASTGDLNLGATLNAPTVSLAALAGNVTEDLGGTVKATTLQASAASGLVRLDATGNGGNQVGTLGAFTAQGVAAYVGAGTVIVSGGASGSAVTLDATGALAIQSTVSSAGTVTLIARGGDINESAAGHVLAGTLSGSASGRLDLSNVSASGNQVGALSGFSTGADLSLTDAAGFSVSGVSAGAPVPATGLGLPTSNGAVSLTARTGTLTVAGDITARAPGRTGVSLLASDAAGDVSQTGGTVATDGAISVVAGRDISLSGGAMTAGGAVTIAAARDATQGAHTLSAGGAITVSATTGGFTQHSGGLVAALGSGSVSIDGPTVTQDAGGAIAAIGSVNLGASGATTIGGTVAGGNVTVGNATKDITITGAIGGVPTFSAPSGLPWPGAITLASNGAGAAGNATVRGDYVYLPGTISAGTSVTLAATHDIFQHARDTGAVSGTIATATLLGSAGTGGATPTLGSASLMGDNAVTNLGGFTATHSFALTNASPLTVNGSVAAGLAAAATAGGAGHGTLADEIAAQPANAASAISRIDLIAPSVTVAGSGQLAVSTLNVNGTVTPGLVALRTDALTLSAPGAISALGGNVEIAGLTATAITLDGSASPVFAAGTLTLTASSLAGISTASAGAPAVVGTQTLVLGRIDGSAASVPNSITVATGPNAINLRGSATVEFNATGDVTETGGGAFGASGIAGTVGGSVRLTAGANAIDRIGVARDAKAVPFSAVTQVAAGLTANASGLASGGDVGVASAAGTLRVIGAVTAGAGGTIALTAPSLVIDHVSIGTNLVSDNAGSLSVAASFGAPVGGVATVTPGLIALRADALAANGPGTLISAPDGTVAIAPFTAGNAISLGGGPGLSISQATLNAISTLGVTTGPLGSQTLALGSLDGGATRLAGNIATGTADTTSVATTVSLFGSGDITGGLVATRLTGSVDGNIKLIGATIGQIGAARTLGAYATAPGLPGETDLIAVGDILVQSRAPSLTVLAGTRVLGGNDPFGAMHPPGSSAKAEIDGLAVTVDGTVQAGVAGLSGTATVRSGVDVATGNAATGPLIVSPGGAVLGNGASGGVTLDAGYDLAGVNVINNRIVNRIQIDGTVGGVGGGQATVQLRAGGGIIETGALLATTLTGRAGFAVDLRGAPGANRISGIGPFDANYAQTGDVVGGLAPFGLVVNDSVALGITGALTDNRSATSGGIQLATVGGNLSVGVAITAGTVDLEAPGMAITDAAPGIITAATLTANAASIDLSAAQNRVASLSGAAINGAFAFADAQTLTIGGAGVSATGGVSLSVRGGDLVANASIGAGTTAFLQALGTTGGTGAIALNSAVTAPNSVTLDADQAVTESGAITTALLTGRVGIAPAGASPGAFGSAALGGDNLVGQLGNFTSAGSFAFNDAQPLQVTGAVRAGLVAGPGDGATISAPGNLLTIAGSVSAGAGGVGGNVMLSAGALAIDGTVTATAGASGGGNVTTASSGDTIATGVVTAASLSGTAGGVASFAGADVATLGSFTTAGTFTLSDSRDLAVAGPVASSGGDVTLAAHAGNGTAGNLTLTGAVMSSTGSTTLTADAAIVQAGGSITAAQTATLTGGTRLAIGGAIAAPTVALAANGDITETGSVAATLLTVQAGIAPSGNNLGSLGSATLGTATNHISFLGDSTVTGSLTLADAQPLTVSGTVATGLWRSGASNYGASLSAPGNTLTVAGTLTAGGPGAAGGDVILSAATIAIPGTIVVTAGTNGGGTLRTASTGDTTEPATGSITANALSGSAGGIASFLGTNTILSIAGFTTAQSLTIEFLRDLAITGAVVSTQGDVTIIAHAGGGTPGNLMIGADVSAFGAAALSADGAVLQTAGSVTAGTTASLTAGTTIALGGTLSAPAVSLAANGDITETGSIATALLMGSAGGSTILNSGNNQIVAIGDFATTGALNLADAQSLTVTGMVSAGAGATLSVPGNTLTVGGTLSATGGDIALSAAALLIPGTVVATPGANGGGTVRIAAGTANGAGSIQAQALTGTTIGDAAFTGGNLVASLAGLSSGGGFTFADSQSLTITAPLVAHGPLALAATANPGLDIVIASTITAPSLDLRATGNITETAGGGLVATTLTGQAASVSLTAGNQVSVLGAFAPANGFSFQNVGDLTVAGPITSSSGDVAITVHAGLGQAGTLMLDAPVGAGGSVTLTSDAALTQASGATIIAGPSATLTSGAAIVIGDALAASTVALAAIGDITETGSVATGLLTLHAGIAPSGAGPGTLGSALLAGGANRIAALGDSAVTGNLVLADTQDLAVNGTVATGLAQLGTATAGQQTFGATLAAPGSTITVAGALSAGGPGAVGGDVSIIAGAVAIPGAVSASPGPNGGGTVTVLSNGNITETGSLSAAVLAGSAGGNASFTNANAVSVVSGFSAGGAFILTDDANLAVTGPVTGATVAIASAGTLTQASGTIQAFASGTPDAPSLRFDGAQGVSLGARTSLIASDVAGVLRIGASGGDISIQGALSSPTIVVSAPGHIITIGSFGGRDTIETGTTASARPVTGIIDGTKFPNAQDSRGIFLDAASIRQLGTTVINGGRNIPGLIDGTARFSLDAKTGAAFGSVTFNDLQAPTTAVYIVIGAGTSSGTINFGGLVVDNSVSPADAGAAGAGSATFNGTVGGIGGSSAAHGSQITPQPNSRYTINNCALQSVNCVLLSPLIVPANNPSGDFEVGTGRRRRDDDDVILPNVAEQDY